MLQLGPAAREHFIGTLAEAQRLGRWNHERVCELALDTAMDIGFASGGHVVPAEAVADQERALQAAGCSNKRRRAPPAPSELPPDEQFPPFEALDELQVQAWMKNAYNYHLDAEVMKLTVPVHASSGKGVEILGISMLDMLRMRTRSSVDDPEQIWASGNVLDFYGGLLRLAALRRPPGEPRLFLFTTDIYRIVERDTFRPSEHKQLRRLSRGIRAELLRPHAKLVFPANQSGNHWVVSLVVITGEGEGDIYYYDSLGDAFQPIYHRHLQEWLRQERSELLGAPSTFRLRMVDLPEADNAAVFRQENIFDCGVFAMMVMRGLTLRHVYAGGTRLIPRVQSLDRKQISARSDYMRRLLLLEMINQRIPFFDWNTTK